MLVAGSLQTYIVRLPDGSTESRTVRVPFLKHHRCYAVNTNKFVGKNGTAPEFRVVDFLCGYHSDVNFDAVSIPTAAVDQEMIRLLSGINDLDKILLSFECGYYTTEHYVRRGRPTEYSDQMDQMGAEILRATELVEKNLPEVSLHNRGLSREQKLILYDTRPDDIFCAKCLGVMYRGWTKCDKCGYSSQP